MIIVLSIIHRTELSFIVYIDIRGTSSQFTTPPTTSPEHDPENNQHRPHIKETGDEESIGDVTKVYWVGEWVLFEGF